MQRKFSFAIFSGAVFNDFGYRLLSDEKPVSLEQMKSFDKDAKQNLSLYNDKAYKIIEADTLLDVGLYEEKVCANGKTKKVEECFRILKTDFVSRPYFHRNRERIIAHFMICYTALLLYRLLEVTLNRYDKQLHFTTRNIIETLQNMNVANFADICYSAQYTGSQTLKALETCFSLGLDRKLFLPKVLNAIRRKKV